MTPPLQPDRWGIVGAESSGKTTLANALVTELHALGQPAVVVPEFLRTWCNLNNRLPQANDQQEILAGQLAAEDYAALENPGAILVCDPVAITQPLYSILYFDDYSQLELTLLDRYERLTWCDIDIPWVPDPLRAGTHLREVMHTLIGRTLANYAALGNPAIRPTSGRISERVNEELGKRGNLF